MILQKIKKLCKACGTVVIVMRSDGSQWLGTPSAMYPVFGIKLTTDSVCALFDRGRLIPCDPDREEASGNV